MPDMTDIISAAITGILEHHADDYNFEFSASCRDFGKDAAAHVAAALETAGYGKRPEPIDPDKATIMNGWLVVEYGSCTCGGGDSASGYHHESGCGYEPLMNITDILNATGYQIVEGFTEWGSEHVIEGKRAIEFHVWPDQNTALEKVGQYGGSLVSRTVTAWKKEA